MFGIGLKSQTSDEINLTFARSQSMDDLDNYEIMNVTAQASPVKSKKLTRQYSKSFHDIDRLDGDNTSFDSGSPDCIFHSAIMFVQARQCVTQSGNKNRVIQPFIQPIHLHLGLLRLHLYRQLFLLKNIQEYSKETFKMCQKA